MRLPRSRACLLWGGGFGRVSSDGWGHGSSSAAPRLKSSHARPTACFSIESDKRQASAGVFLKSAVLAQAFPRAEGVSQCRAGRRGGRRRDDRREGEPRSRTRAAAALQLVSCSRPSASSAPANRSLLHKMLPRQQRSFQQPSGSAKVDPFPVYRPPVAGFSPAPAAASFGRRPSPSPDEPGRLDRFVVTAYEVDLVNGQRELVRQLELRRGEGEMKQGRLVQCATSSSTEGGEAVDDTAGVWTDRSVPSLQLIACALHPITEDGLAAVLRASVIARGWPTNPSAQGRRGRRPPPPFFPLPRRPFVHWLTILPTALISGQVFAPPSPGRAPLDELRSFSPDLPGQRLVVSAVGRRRHLVLLGRRGRRV